MLINLKQQKKATRRCFRTLFFFANYMTSSSSKNIKYNKKVSQFSVHNVNNFAYHLIYIYSNTITLKPKFDYNNIFV